MIANIIEESYNNKSLPRRIINIHYEREKEPFHQMEIEKQNNSSPIKWKIKRTEKKINEEIDDLLFFSLIDDKNDKNDPSLEQLKFCKVQTPMAHTNKNKLKLGKYLFKGDLLMLDKIKKTKIKEFSFSKSAKNKLKGGAFINIRGESRNKFNNKNKLKNILTPLNSLSKVSSLNPIKFYNISNSDCFFITKLPNYFKSNSLKSKETKLKKMKKIIKDTNSHILDIYTGLKNMKKNKFSIYDDPLSFNDKKKYKKGFRNIDKLNLGMKKSQSLSNINRRFKRLFQKIFDNKKCSNEKLDTRTLLDPLEKITGGAYKEVKLDNQINNKVGQRIWIKKSTANIVSYGKSFQLISDDIFYKERKRIIEIYPKIEREAEILIPRKKIKRRHPLLKKLQENINKINNVFLSEYKLVNKYKKKSQ